MAIWRQFVLSLRLQLRNPTALVYSYAIPLVFLAAFWTLYRHESPPLGRHLDELLTITALSGACFGLPAWLVSERERGIWRRYRLAPLPGGVHLAGKLGASYLLLLSAGVLQIVAAVAVGTPLPSRLFDLWLAFTLVCVAFLGLGLLITMLADTVPAAQALGQVVFLPMLIVGGVAVPLAEPARLGATRRGGASGPPCRRCARRRDLGKGTRGCSARMSRRWRSWASRAVLRRSPSFAGTSRSGLDVLRTILPVGLAVGVVDRRRRRSRMPDATRRRSAEVAGAGRHRPFPTTPPPSAPLDRPDQHSRRRVDGT